MEYKIEGIVRKQLIYVEAENGDNGKDYFYEVTTALS